MIPGWTPIGTEPIGAIPESDALGFVVPSVLSALLADQEADLVFLMECTPLMLSAGASAFPYAIGEQPMMTLLETQYPEIVRLSDYGYITSPSDDPANVPYAPRLRTPYSFETSVPTPEEGRAIGSAGFGLIEIENGDEALDSLLGRSWEGREVRLFVGGKYHVGRADEYTLAFGEFGLIQRAYVASVASEHGLIILSLDDALAKLDKPIQKILYTGEGGTEGGDAIAGLQKPLLFGQAYNLPAVLVDEVDLIFQVHTRSMEAFDAVRDQGVGLTADGDISTLGLATLADWTPVGGHYVTDLAQGLFRVGGQPTGQITADARGDNVGGYVDSTPKIVRRIAVDFAGLQDPGDLDALSFGTFPNTDAVGIFTGTSELRILDVLGDLLRAADGWLTATRKGKLRIGAYTTPEKEPIADQITDDLLTEIADESVPEPAWRVRVGYERMWTVQSEDALAGGVSAADRALYSQEYRYASAEDGSVRAVHRSAREIEVPSYFAAKASADALAKAKLQRLKVRRRRYQARVERALFKRRIAETLRTTSDESDLDSGRALWIYGLAETGHDREVRLELWG